VEGLGGCPGWMQERSQGDAASHSAKSVFPGISLGNSSDTDLTVEANQPMQAELRQHVPEIELTALYRRRETVSKLIRSLERYRRTRVLRIQKRSRWARQAAT
jgi:hypothetical protein